MSSEAIGWVFRHSPYRGATLAVHLSIADSVNDQHGYELWMRQGVLAQKSRTTRKSVNDAIATMTADGFLDLVEERKGGANRYLFLMPDVAVIYDPRRGVVTTGDTQGVTTRDTGVTPGDREGVTPGDTEPKKSEPKPQPKEFSSDVERLCALLADLISNDGSKRPEITTRWREECDRLIRLDKHTPEQIERLMRWCQEPGNFWRANILSMPKFREKFDQMRKKANDELAARRSKAPRGPGWVPSAEDEAAERALPTRLVTER